MSENKYEDLSKKLNRVMTDLSMHPDEPRTTATVSSIAEKRRYKNRRGTSLASHLVVVEQDGVFRLTDKPPRSRPGSGGRRGIHRPGRAMGTIVAEHPIQLLPHSQIPGAIAKLDDKLTPQRGIRMVKQGRIVGKGDDVSPIHQGKILLFVHGTFSESEAFLKQIKRPSFTQGRRFLNWANKGYDQILTFDHPTLAVSPMINARELAWRLKDTHADIDVICHSRGGLVTRWWLEAFDRGLGKRRVVFVASPLNGTGLAAPPNIRHAIDMVFTMGNAIAKVTAAIPFMAFATGLFQIVNSITRIAAKTPLVDSIVAMVPGLAAQARVENNFERKSLRLDAYRESQKSYFAIVSNFESEKVGWKFWRHFRKKNLLDSGMDTIFEGPNDLVVDTSSMTSLKDGLRIPNANVYDYGTTDKIYHTNYFEQSESLDFIMNKL